jgi:hypothetical protein
MTQDERFDRIDAALERMGQHSEQRFGTLTRYVLDFRKEAFSRFERMDERLSIMNATLVNLNSQMAINTKAMLQNVEQVDKLFADQWNQKQAAVDLAARVEKLEGAA